MNIRREFTLKEFVEFLTSVSKKSIPEVSQQLELNVATAYNWYGEKTKRVSIAQIERLAPKLKKLFGVEVGKITTSTIELKNVPPEFAASGVENDPLYQLYRIEDIYRLTVRMARIEAENEDLKEKVRRMERKYEGKGDDNQEGDRCARQYSYQTRKVVAADPVNFNQIF